MRRNGLMVKTFPMFTGVADSAFCCAMELQCSFKQVFKFLLPSLVSWLGRKKAGKNISWFGGNPYGWYLQWGNVTKESPSVTHYLACTQHKVASCLFEVIQKFAGRMLSERPVWLWNVSIMEVLWSSCLTKWVILLVRCWEEFQIMLLRWRKLLLAVCPVW